MSKNIYSVITGTGSYIPSKVVTNEDFKSNEFYESNGEKINRPTEEITSKFFDITTIAERRYVTENMMTSDLAHLAAEEAIQAAGIDREELDYVIVANNFGNTAHGATATEHVPAVASIVKQKLQIKNPEAVAYDIIFGCPGWVQAVIQADYFIKSGDAKKVLVIGADVLSRISDPHDRDSMIYADGAGAVVMEARESETPVGIVAHKTRSDSHLYAKLLHMGPSFNKEAADKNQLYIKMNGRRLYQYALENVPVAIKAALEKGGYTLADVHKVLIHQANGKMDDAILARLFKLYGIEEMPEGIMPMTVQDLGNSSVATVPTLLDLITRNKLEGHSIKSGDLVVLASVGAGMNINAIIYKAE